MSQCDFSFRHYGEILQAALDRGYRFGTYEEMESAEGHFTVLRHDIDYTPERALRFAQEENARGIRAYYFFQVCCEIYNLRDRKVWEVVQSLHRDGHHVGLHFDLAWNTEIEWEQAAAQCAAEKQLFESLTGVKPCEIISFHNPHKFTHLILNQPVQGMMHSYEKRFFADIKYLSDSQGWYEGCMCGVYAHGKYEKIQLLTHPYIWSESPKEDFTADMAAMIHEKSQKLVDYMVKYHPVAAKNAERLKSLTDY